MNFRDAQRDVRDAYLGGGPGGFVSGALWLAMAALATRGLQREAMTGLFVGGLFIFPLGNLMTRLLGGSARMAKDNPLNGLGMQAAFIVPLGWPLVVAAGIANPAWYFPAAAWLVAVHYLPFITLYGMRSYAVLAAALFAGAWACVQFAPGTVAAAAWCTGAVEVAFGVIVLAMRRRSAVAVTA